MAAARFQFQFRKRHVWKSLEPSNGFNDVEFGWGLRAELALGLKGWLSFLNEI